MSYPNMRPANITRRYFLRGLGLLSAGAALAACAQQPKEGGNGGSKKDDGDVIDADFTDTTDK